MTCEQASGAITASFDRPLPTLTRAGLRVHLLFCTPCRRYRHQVTRAHDACRGLFSGDDPGPAAELHPEARARIDAALDDHLRPG